MKVKLRVNVWKHRSRAWRWLNISLLRRLWLKVRGLVYYAHLKLRGWSGFAPFYVASCRIHGFFLDYVHGFPGNQYVLCPRCFDEEYGK